MRGGKRDGAGRKKNSLTRKTVAMMREAAQEGLTPLDYMLSVLRAHDSEPSAKMDAAKAAAPFVHPRLTAVEMNANLRIEVEAAAEDLISVLLPELTAAGKGGEACEAEHGSAGDPAA